MGRARIHPGTWGAFQSHKQGGKVRVRVYYRRLDGTRGDAVAYGKSAKEGERKLLARLPDLVTRVSDVTASETPETFAALADEWVKHITVLHENGDMARGTYAEKKRLLQNVLLPRLAERRLDSITPRVVSTVYLEMVDKWQAQARNAKGVLSQVLAYASQMEYIPNNPVDKIRSIRRPRKEIFAPSITELRAFREAVVAYNEDPDRPGPPPGPLLLDVIDMILATSHRVGEVLGLRWDKDVRLLGSLSEVTVNGAVKEKGGPKRWEPYPKTEAGRRTTRLTPAAIAILERRYAGNTTGSEYVFHTRSGAPNGPQDVHRAIRRVREYAGLPSDYVPHALRKNVATTIANTAGLEAASVFIGNARSRVTETGLNEVSYAIGWTAWLDIAPQGVDKGSALARVHAELGIGAGEVLVVGDGRNDIGMFEWARRTGGRAVAMGQAPDEVKDAAGEVTANVEDGGLARALDALGAGQRPDRSATNEWVPPTT